MKRSGLRRQVADFVTHTSQSKKSTNSSARSQPATAAAAKPPTATASTPEPAIFPSISHARAAAPKRAAPKHAAAEPAVSAAAVPARPAAQCSGGGTRGSSGSSQASELSEGSAELEEARAKRDSDGDVATTKVSQGSTNTTSECKISDGGEGEDYTDQGSSSCQHPKSSLRSSKAGINVPN